MTVVMAKIINKQAFFIVRMARNLQDMTPQNRQAALAAMPTKVRGLVNQAIMIFDKKKAGVE